MILKYQKIAAFLLITAGLWISILAWAAEDDGTYIYYFHLYYDNGKLVKDRDFGAAFDLLAEPYIQPEQEGDGFVVKIYSVNNLLINESSFSDVVIIKSYDARWLSLLSVSPIESAIFLSAYFSLNN